MSENAVNGAKLSTFVFFTFKLDEWHGKIIRDIYALQTSVHDFSICEIEMEFSSKKEKKMF